MLFIQNKNDYYEFTIATKRLSLVDDDYTHVSNFYIQNNALNAVTIELDNIDEYDNEPDFFIGNGLAVSSNNRKSKSLDKIKFYDTIYNIKSFDVDTLTVKCEPNNNNFKLELNGLLFKNKNIHLNNGFYINDSIYEKNYDEIKGLSNEETISVKASYNDNKNKNNILELAISNWKYK